MRTGTDPFDGASRASWPAPPALIALAFAWLVLGWPWLSGRVTIPWDAKAHYLPQAQFLAQSFARGESPFWLPFAYSGHPQVADPQSLIFSPPYVLAALLSPGLDGYVADLTLLISVLVSASALLLWCHDRGWHWAAALLTAISFAFGAAMAWRIQHTGQVLSLCYLPVTLLLLDRALNRGSTLGGSTLYGIAAGIVAAFMVIGRDQVALLGAYTLIAYVIWHLSSAPDGFRRILRSAAAPLAGGILAGMAIVALPVLMTAFVAIDSNRPSIDFIGAGRGSLHPALLLTAFAPDVFGSSGRMEDYWGPPSFTWTGTDLFIAQNVGQLYFGAIPLLALLIGAASGTLWQREIRFFTIALVVTLLYALGWYTPVFGLLHAWLPGIEYFRRPADAVFPIGLLSAIVAGYALHRLIIAPRFDLGTGQIATVAAIVTAAFLSAILLALYFGRIDRVAFPLAVAAALLAGGAACLAAALWLMPIRPRLATALLVAFTVGDLAVSNGPGSATALPPEAYDVADPRSRNATLALLKEKVAASASNRRRDRVELVGLGFHWANVSLTHRLENTLGYNPLRLALYADAVGAGDHAIGPADRKFTPLFPSYNSTLANLLGLRFIATPIPVEKIDHRLAPDDLALVARTEDAYIYENPRALPRVMFADEAVSANFDDMLTTGVWPTKSVTRTVALEDSNVGPPRRPGSASITVYGNTEVEIEATSPDGGWVVLNDVWHPWWTVDVDRAPARLLRANVLFRAVEVPPGTHTVRFTFSPVEGAVSALVASWRSLSFTNR